MDADVEVAAREAVIGCLNANCALPALNAWAALALAKRGRGGQVLLTDVGVPGLDGSACIGRRHPRVTLRAALHMAESSFSNF